MTEKLKINVVYKIDTPPPAGLKKAGVKNFYLCNNIVIAAA